jgi:cbb3-type cytochrome oxidase subunit 3
MKPIMQTIADWLLLAMFVMLLLILWPFLWRGNDE